MLQEFFALRITILTILNFHVAKLPSNVRNKYVETSLKLMVINFRLEYDLICQGEPDLIPTVAYTGQA